MYWSPYVCFPYHWNAPDRDQSSPGGVPIAIALYFESAVYEMLDVVVVVAVVVAVAAADVQLHMKYLH